jgi:hypothetical protein
VSAVLLTYALGLRGIVMWIVAFIGSGVASYFMLGKQRDEMGRSVESMLSAINDRIDQSSRKEDID